MKIGKGIGISVIRTESREGTEDLKKLHYELNDILYKYHTIYLSRCDAFDVYKKLCDMGKSIAELKVPEKAKKKQEEILKQLRLIAHSVKDYASSFEWKKDDLQQIQKSINYKVFKLVEDKKENKFNTIQYIVEQLEDIRRLRKNMIEDSHMEDSLKLNSLMDFNKELLDMVNSRYG